jgi:hypothetical protein
LAKGPEAPNATDATTPYSTPIVVAFVLPEVAFRLVTG